LLLILLVRCGAADMINDKFSDKEYWEGVQYACEYFRDELGFEDATYTSLYEQATEELSVVGGSV